MPIYVQLYKCISLSWVKGSTLTFVTSDFRGRSVRFLRLLWMYISIHLYRYMSIHIPISIYVNLSISIYLSIYLNTFIYIFHIFVLVTMDLRRRSVDDQCLYTSIYIYMYIYIIYYVCDE